jgi:ribulose-phosphate 3-epimerase
MAEGKPRGVAPSILSADFARLGAQVEEVLDAGARVIHVDVMDGQFVPQITMGALVVDALKPLATGAGALLDVHLMVDRPERHVAAFASAGADVITLHAEATPHVHYGLSAVRAAGCLAGLALCPGTPLEPVAEVASVADLVLCMTVNPGWGGQAFLEHSVGRLERLRDLVDPEVTIEVDGGIDVGTAPRCAAAGASLFVAGSSVFGAPDPGEAVRALADAIAAGAPR